MALAKRKSLRPLMEPAYSMEGVPRCVQGLSTSAILRPTRAEWQAAMGEIVLLCNEAVARATERRSAAAAVADPATARITATPTSTASTAAPANATDTKFTHEVSGPEGPTPVHGSGLVTKEAAPSVSTPVAATAASRLWRYPSKPLSIEFIADRLDIDDPLNGLMVRDKAHGRLQGFVSWTTFTHWQRHFRWDSLHPAAAMDEDHVDEFPAAARANDDGSLARRLAAQVFDGDVMGAGVVSPRIAEIALLGGLGCGRFLMQAVIAEMERPESPYDFVVLQATEGSIPFYEALGFVRVGAVCRYLADDAEGPLPEGENEGDEEGGDGHGYDHERSYCTSRFYYYTDTRENDTPRQIAARLEVDLDDLLFINQVLWGTDGISGSSRLRRGTPLRIPCSGAANSKAPTTAVQEAKSPVRRWHKCGENDTPKSVAAALGLDVDALVLMNAGKYKGLTRSSTLRRGTRLLIPTDDYMPEDINPDLTEWVTYRHWTFPDSIIDYTEDSYMMARALRPRTERTDHVLPGTPLACLQELLVEGWPTGVLAPPCGMPNRLFLSPDAVQDESGSKTPADSQQLTPSEEETAAAVSTVGAVVKSVATSAKETEALCRQLYDRLAAITVTDCDGDVRQVADAFMELPSAADYPSYYKAIKRPVAFATVRAKLARYKSTKACAADFQLMFRNAQVFNEDGSEVFEDAKLLRSELRLVMGSIAKDAGNDAGSKATRSLATATMAAPVLEPATVERTRPTGLSSKPKQPLSAFFLFTRDARPEVKAAHPEMPVSELAKLLGARWQALDSTQRAPYVAEATAAKQRYRKELAAYRQDCERLGWVDTAKRKTGKGDTDSIGGKAAKRARTPPEEGKLPRLFNKVVRLQNDHDGRYWFVLTYIPDLAWCHIAPMVQRGVFGDAGTEGTKPELEGKPRWVLTPEGAEKERDVSAFNLKVVKCRTVKRVQDADKEEWVIDEPALARRPATPAVAADIAARGHLGAAAQASGVGFQGRASPAAPEPPATGGLEAGEAATVHGAAPSSPSPSAAAEPWYRPITPVTALVGKGGAILPGSVVFAVGQAVRVNWRSKGRWFPGTISSARPDGFDITFDDGDFEASVPPQRIRLAAAKRPPSPDEQPPTAVPPGRRS